MSSSVKKPKYTLDSKINTSQAHLQGLTIQQIIDRDTNGDNILTLLYYRYSANGKNTSLTDRGFPFSYFEFDDEVNATLDVFLYANPELLKKFKPRYTKGELMAKIRELEKSEKLRAARKAKEFQEAEQRKMDEYLAQARAEQERKTAYATQWGTW